MKMKKLLLASIIVIAANTLFTSCSKDKGTDPITPITPTPTEENTIVVSGNITANTTWTNNKTYILNGRVIVTSGTLTIQAGTVIKGRAGTNSNASSLIIARGAKIDAQGTPSSPIIFTSEADAIVSGQIESPNLDASQTGLWGGVAILGNAPVSDLNGGATGQLEGIPASVTEGAYGGSNAADNSGVFKYVSIRHGGTVYQPGKELNGLTLCGVGTGTEINHIEIIGNSDDGIEFFGGSVNLSSAIIYKGGDDGLDIDQSYSGTISNFIIFQGVNSDKAFEIDGPENAVNPTGTFTIDSGYVVGDATNPFYAHFKAGAQGTMKNVYFTSFKTPATTSEGLWIATGSTQTNYDNNNLVITSNVFNLTSLTIADITEGTTNDVKMTSNNTIGMSSNGVFNASAFTGWSLASSKGWLLGLN